MHFYLLLDLVWLELRSTSESIQPVLINLGRPKFEFDSAHEKNCVWAGPNKNEWRFIKGELDLKVHFNPENLYLHLSWSSVKKFGLIITKKFFNS